MLVKRKQKKLRDIKSASRYRIRPIIEPLAPNKIRVSGYECINFSSNDYLGLHKHPKVLEVFINACQRYGVGSGASAFVSGYSMAHQEAETQFAAWLGVDRAVLFGSGYCANTSIIAALSQRDNTIFSDKLCHTSLLDGILLSRAKHIRFRHNDIDHLTRLAEEHTPSLIVTESINSMEGDITPLTALVKLAKHYQSGLIIDDAHGIGVLGKHGQGAVDLFDLCQADYTCLVLPLGKSFNAMGAMVAGNADMMDCVLQFAKSYCYSTALPPAICLAIQASLQVLQEETWRQQQLKKNSRFFIEYANAKGLTLISKDETPIKSILVHTNENAIALQEHMLKHGFYVSCIRPPTVPINKARLRLSINSLHTENQMMQLIDHIIDGLRPC